MAIHIYHLQIRVKERSISPAGAQNDHEGLEEPHGDDRLKTWRTGKTNKLVAFALQGIGEKESGLFFIDRAVAGMLRKK